MKHKSTIISQYIRSFAFFKYQTTLNNTQIQKLLYIILGKSLSEYNYQIVDELPNVWPYGPVFPKARKYVLNNPIIPLDSIDFSSIDEKSKDIIENVVSRYYLFSGTKLSYWSQEDGGAWQLALIDNDNKYGSLIKKDFIKKYFDILKV